MGLGEACLFTCLCLGFRSCTFVRVASLLSECVLQFLDFRIYIVILYNKMVFGY